MRMAKEAGQQAAPVDPKLGTGAKVATGAGVTVALAAVAYEIAQQMGLLN